MFAHAVALSWPRVLRSAVFLIVDLAFLGANADKVAHGGWFPLVLGSVCSR